MSQDDEMRHENFLCVMVLVLLTPDCTISEASKFMHTFIIILNWTRHVYSQLSLT